MFAQEVLVEEEARERLGVRSELEGIEGHAGAHFEGDAVVEGAEGVGSPCERGVAVLEDGWHRGGIDAEGGERFRDGAACEEFVGVGGFLGTEHAADWDFAMEVVCMGCAEAGQRSSGLRPCGGGWAVGVADSAGGREGAVDFEVGGSVRRRLAFAFHGAARFQFEDDEVVVAQVAVRDAAGFDDHEAAAAVETADIAPCEGDEA